MTVKINASTSSGLVMDSDLSGIVEIQNNGTTAMTVTGGNVGIGVVPNGISKLQLQTATNGNVTALTWSDNITDTGYLGVRSGGGISMWAGGFLAFGSGSGTFSEKMRIDSSGNLLVGTTSSSGRLTVYTLSGVGQYIKVQEISPTVMQFRNAQDLGGSITIASGGSTSFNTSSDYRLKENIAPMIGALDTVAKLKPVTYKWKADGSDGQGFIAHELQAVIPDCVTGEKDAVEIVDDLDADGKKIGTKEVPRYQGIDTSFLVATLTAAIQELNAKVTALEAQLGAK
jgi:hypothetical protein